jgi:hypothetical protein
MNEPILCYIDGPWAFFTTQELSKQWGDDWNDFPFQHNAGDPYTPFGTDTAFWEITKVAFTGPFDTPADKGGSYSVQMINNKEVAWLSPDGYGTYKEGRPEPIFAGVTLDEFITKVEASGGVVYLTKGK